MAPATRVHERHRPEPSRQDSRQRLLRQSHNDSLTGGSHGSGERPLFQIGEELPCNSLIRQAHDSLFRYAGRRPLCHMRRQAGNHLCCELDTSDNSDYTSITTLLDVRYSRPHNDMPRQTRAYLNAVLHFAIAVGMNTEYFDYLDLDELSTVQLRGLSYLLDDMKWSSGTLPAFDQWKIEATGRRAICVSSSDVRDEVIQVLDRMQNVYGTRLELPHDVFANVIMLVHWTGRAHVQLTCTYDRSMRSDSTERIDNMRAFLQHTKYILPSSESVHTQVLQYEEQYTDLSNLGEIPVLHADDNIIRVLVKRFTELIAAIQVIDGINVLCLFNMEISRELATRARTYIRNFLQQRYGNSIPLFYDSLPDEFYMQVKAQTNDRYAASFHYQNHDGAISISCSTRPE